MPWIEKPGKLFLAALLAAIVFVVIMSGRLVIWPIWQRHQAVRTLSSGIADATWPELEKAAQLLTRTGSSDVAIDLLNSALSHESRNVRQRACYGLGYVGTDAIPTLLRALEQDDNIVRVWAVDALGNVGSKTDTVVPALTRMLEDQDSLVRLNAATTLGRIGPKAESAIPTLVKLAESDPHMKDEIVRILSEIDSDGGLSAAKTGKTNTGYSRPAPAR